MRKLLVSSVAVLLMASPAWAQINEGPVETENIQPLDAAQPTLEYVCAGGFLLAAMAAGFKPSKRTHD